MTGPKGREYSKENIRRLTNIHIARYNRMIERALKGQENIRIKECTMYLNIWEGVERAGYDWLYLSTEQRREVEDAIASGE